MEIKDKPPDYFKCVKVPITHILKHQDINISKITDTVIMANKIVIHTLQFMKLYLLNHYNKHNTLPVIDKSFINTCTMKNILRQLLLRSGLPSRSLPSSRRLPSYRPVGELGAV